MEKKSVAILPVGLLAVSMVALAGYQLTKSTTPGTSNTVVASSAPTTNSGASPTLETVTTSASSQAQQIDTTVTYDNPGGGDPVRFQLEIKDGVITKASSEVLADNAISQKYQTAIAQAISGVVVGKTLSELQVDRIGGASLTSGALRKVVQELQQQ